MAIKYVVNHEKKSVTAILEGTKFDAINRINNRIHNTDWYLDPYDVHEKFLMPDKFVSTVKCDERDEFDVGFGMERAKKVVLDNYYHSMNKRIKKWTTSMADMIGRFMKMPDVIEITT